MALITSLPLLLSIADLGFADAAASQMTMEIAKGNRPRRQNISINPGMTVVMCLALGFSWPAAVVYRSSQDWYGAVRQASLTTALSLCVTLHSLFYQSFSVLLAAGVITQNPL